MRKHPLWRKWLWCLLPAVIAAAMYFLLPLFPTFTEWAVTRGLFRLVAFPAEWGLSLIPFSVTELVVVLGPLALLLLAIVWIVRIIRHPGRRGQIAEKGCRFVVGCLSAVLLVFMVMDGGNFSRIPLGQLMELPQRQYTANELFAVTVDLAEKASVAREQVQEDAQGYMQLSASMRKTLGAADNCYHPLIDTYPFLRTGTWQIKPVALSHLWSYTGTTGVYCPWLGEANVNVDIPHSEIGYTAAHEIGHTIGFAKENECNFLAYLACTNSGNPDFAYSGYLSAFINCINAMARNDEPRVGEAYTHCSQGVLRDLQQRRDYWDSFEGKTMEVSQQVNDTFIKVNGVPSGVISYSEMVELVLRYYDQQGWIA